MRACRATFHLPHPERKHLCPGYIWTKPHTRISHWLPKRDLALRLGTTRTHVWGARASRTPIQDLDENRSVLGQQRDQDPRLCCSQPGCGHVAQAITYFKWKTSISSQVFLTQALPNFVWYQILLRKSSPRKCSATFQLSTKLLTFARVNSFPLQSLPRPFRAPAQVIRSDANTGCFILGQSDKLAVLSELSCCDAVTAFS